jgi:GTPase SAR1 family protein
VSNESFLAAQDYLENISEILKKNEEANEKKFVKIVLLGNKIDLERYRYVNLKPVLIIH